MKYSKTRICPKNPRSVENFTSTLSYCLMFVHSPHKESLRHIGHTLFAGDDQPSGRPRTAPHPRIPKRTHPSYWNSKGYSLEDMEHRTQTALYTLLLWEPYGVDTKDGLPFHTRAREKKSCGSYGDEIGFLLSSHSATSHRQRAPMHAMLRPPHLPAFPQGTSRLLIFCSQEAVDIHPLITPSSRLYSIRGQTEQTMSFRDWDRLRNGI